jgi:lysophospholipase L1-like esterase
MPYRTRFFPLVALAAGAVLLLVSGCAAWRIGQAVDLARQSVPLQHRPADPVLRMLIVGDSTAVGTGASAPEASVAGLLAAAYPKLQIDNRARDGATFEGVVNQLAGSERYDLILISAGGNDVIRLRNADEMRNDIDRATELARARSERVLLMPAGNVGNAPFFVPPASWLMTRRARTLHALVRESSERHGAVYINLFKDAAQDPFVQQPGLNAVDGLHPSDAGYCVWFDELMAQGRLAEVLAPAR